MRERKALRRVAAILFHRRAGFSANGMGVWKVPEERIMEVAPLMASFRGISHCYQRPTYDGLALLGVHHGPRPLARRSATPSSTRSPRRAGSRSARTLYSSTEFKKIRLLYFTDAHRRWEAEHT